MGTLRRATYRAGGVGTPMPGAGGPGGQQAYGGRTTGSPALPSGLSIAPPYRVTTQPGAAGRHPYLDFSKPAAWRNAGAVLAAAYLAGFHVSVGAVRVRAPVPHGHVLALGLYVVSWVYLAKFGTDVLAAAYPSPAMSALRQSI